MKILYNKFLTYYVYILANTSRKVLYIGVTSNLDQRVDQHNSNEDKNSFTNKYNVHDLIYFEEFSDIKEAIKREKQLKGWSRSKKITLISSMNAKLETLDINNL